MRHLPHFVRQMSHFNEPKKERNITIKACKSKQWSNEKQSNKIYINLQQFTAMKLTMNPCKICHNGSYVVLQWVYHWKFTMNPCKICQGRFTMSFTIASILFLQWILVKIWQRRFTIATILFFTMNPCKIWRRRFTMSFTIRAVLFFTMNPCKNLTKALYNGNYSIFYNESL